MSRSRGGLIRPRSFVTVRETRTLVGQAFEGLSTPSCRKKNE
jgi:hypothetical protein